jgi:hypothetical protein
MSETIKVSTEGNIFDVKKETLRNIPYFKKLFKHMEKNGHEDMIYLDRSAKAFSHILRWARNENCILPGKYRDEYDFYLMDMQSVNIEDTPNCIADMRHDINNILKYQVSHKKSLNTMSVNGKEIPSIIVYIIVFAIGMMILSFSIGASFLFLEPLIKLLINN